MSDSARWARVNELFHAAVATPTAERATFLAAQCSGDVALRAEVESLLTAHRDDDTGVRRGVVVGARLGDYEVTGFIAAGGMGEVYRARDAKLRREVALKILPAAFVADPERCARFEREARLLASLNHPNIAHIHGLEESGGVRALVMELVEGEDLSQRIARGAIPLDEALPIAKQVAEALEAAHEQGIIHRDLKPANIKVRSDGTVKVLDFGLAKAMAPARGSSPNLSQSPTITTPAVTQAGMILGTAAYMSPEQAKGREADKHSDIWAFGAVLYEMLTGRRAFDGEDTVDVLSCVLQREPVWVALPTGVSPTLVLYLKRCLYKDSKQRLGDMHDMRLALEGAPRLLSGTVIGPYRVTELIGAGGMGEVYRARDTKLGRDVAVKVLPAAFTSDADRLARFEREARVLATLNHPHIGAIYGLEEADPSAGSGQAAVRALVLELVEGDTLAERLAVGPLPIQEALTVARQIADALEAAHEKGIVHRDLKPGNIKITPDGTVKVLDFGLAKAAAGDAFGSDLSQSPAVSIGGTREGVILGTAAYMSPEQARGQQIDKRTDIWAFGCVLYEMLTGRVAFAGDTTSDTIARVLERSPDWQALPEATPAPVTRLLQRCLDKDPKRRLHDIADARIEIEDVLSSASRTRSETAVVDPQRRPVRLPWSTAANASLVALVAVGALTWWTLRSAPQSQAAPPRVVRTEVTTSGAPALTIGGVDRDLAITPDGSRIIYRGTNQLLVRALDQLEPYVLSGLGAPRGVFVSPDGQWIGFFDGNPLLKKVAMTGGPPLTITRTDGSGPRGATWGPDGTIVYATNAPATGLLRVSAAGGDHTVLTKPNRERGESDHLWPEFLPGGQAVLFTITAATGGTITAATGGLDKAQIAVLEMETGTYKVLVRGGSHAHYVPTGHLVYGAGDKLRAVAFDLDRLEAVGTPVTVLEQVATTAQGAVDAAIAANGTMAYIPGGGTPDQETVVVWADRQLGEEPTKIPPGFYLRPRLSPDGQKVALSAFRADGSDVWVYDFRRATFTRLTFEGNNNRPVWTPDGARIAFSSSRAGATPTNIYWLPVDGSAAAERLTTGPFDQVPEGWAPDGKTLMFSEFRPDSGWDIWTLSATDRKPQLFLRTPFHEFGRAFSPDGRWLAYYSDESGRGEVQVRPFPGPGPKWQISTEGGAEPVWASSGRELFYRSGNRLMVADVQLVPAFSARAPRLLFEGTYRTSFDVSPDGRRFIMIKPADAASRLVVVQNWTEELKRLVPTK